MNELLISEWSLTLSDNLKFNLIGIPEGRGIRGGTWLRGVGREGKVLTYFILSHPHQSLTADKENIQNQHYSLIPHSSLQDTSWSHRAQKNKETLFKQTARDSIEDPQTLKVWIRNDQYFTTFLCLVFPEILS